MSTTAPLETICITDAIKQLYSMLREEERLWDTTDKSKTVEMIQKYSVFVFILQSLSTRLIECMFECFRIS